MPKCVALRGIFVPRPCNNQAGQLCEQCHRPVCPEHSSVKSGSVLCLGCEAAKVPPDAAQPMEDQDNPAYWRRFLSTRREDGRFGRMSHYGMYYDPMFSERDMSDFDSGERGGFSGFGDRFSLVDS